MLTLPYYRCIYKLPLQVAHILVMFITMACHSHSISVRYRYLLMLFGFNILVSTFHCAWPAWMPAKKPDIKWIWCKLWPYTSCYRWLQTHQPNLHCATDPYTCATLCYKQGGLPQVYHCYSGYIALLIWPLFSWCRKDCGPDMMMPSSDSTFLWDFASFDI